MYGNMTREEMIQRLYKGDFATGELERQLIAKIFEQCCGGGSSSGGINVVGINVESGADGTVFTFDKTAAEIIEMAETGLVFTKAVATEGSVIIKEFNVIRQIVDASGAGQGYLFVLGDIEYTATSTDEYPSYVRASVVGN